MSGKLSLLEELMCSQANFENLVKMVPVIANHPMYAIAKQQLDDAIERLEKDGRS